MKLKEKYRSRTIERVAIPTPIVNVMTSRCSVAASTPHSDLLSGC